MSFDKPRSVSVVVRVREACLEVDYLASWLSGRVYTYKGREKVVKRASSLDCDRKEEIASLRQALGLHHHLLLFHTNTFIAKIAIDLELHVDYREI
jgi:hypothetical protein